MDERDDKIAQGLVRIAEILERISARQDDNTLALAQILERIVQTTDRTEQMTARILAEMARPGQTH